MSDLEKIREIEEVVAWNLSFGITPKQTLDEMFNLTDEEKKEILELHFKIFDGFETIEDLSKI